jgi:GAF domain-containing protein
MVERQPADLSSDLTRVAAIPANLSVVDAALRLVVALTRATVGCADGVSVTLNRHGQMTTVASSDETIVQMDRDQYATGQGPCLAAAAEGSWFHVESLAEETRWPEFIPRAIQGGIRSILSTPLLAAAGPVGALNIYSNAERAFRTEDQELAALFATEASGILTTASVDVPAEQVAARLADVLRAREVIAQAQGVIMEREGVSAEEAFAHLRRSSRHADMPMRQYADDVVASARRQITPSE